MKKICIIGTGYVGLVTGACFEHLGHQVTCVDTNQSKINKLKGGQCPIYEKGLEELLQKAQRLSFTTDLSSAIKDSEIIFICVGTPEKDDGNADLTFVYNACKSVADSLADSQTVVIKSTVPVMAVTDIKAILDKANVTYNLVSNPEFLAQGTAVKDFLEPDRIVVGADSTEGIDQVASLYKKVDAPLIKTDLKSAIITKYTANAFLATKVSFINSIARLCEKVGANITAVAYGIGLDRRIGGRFLNAGIGYGGSCFPKDTKALIRTGDDAGVDLGILKEVDKVNDSQRLIIIEKLSRLLGDLTDKHICLLGLAFKPGTDDVREAPALYLVKELIKTQSKLSAFDPIVKKVKGFDGQIKIMAEPYQAVEGADAIVLVTEHPEFNDLDFSRIKQLAKGNVVIDGRNFLDAEKIVQKGFVYEGIGI